MKTNHWKRASFEHLEARNLLATDLGNVLFLGDSITHGAGYTPPTGNYDSYRFELWKRFIDPPAVSGTAETHEFDFNFVGTQNSFFNQNRTLTHNGMTFPNIHEGHFAWTAAAINNNLDGWLQTYDADLAFIHLATNDLRIPNNLTGAVSHVSSIIDKLQADNPNITIIVAQIIPFYAGVPFVDADPSPTPVPACGPATAPAEFDTAEELQVYNDDIIAFNATVASSTSTWSTATSRVYTVNHHNDPANPGNWLPQSHYVACVHPNSGIGAQTMAERWYDGLQAIPPTVTEVRVSSTGWGTEFVNQIDPIDASQHPTDTANPGLNLGYQIPYGPGQTDTIPWHNTNQIHVTFEEEVLIDETDVSLTGIYGHTYSFPPGSVSFDDTTNTATIALPPNLTRDALTLTIADSVTDLNGNALDGEWTDNQTTPRSGNGTAGGDFVFSLNVLPGDVSQNSFIDGTDLSQTRDKRFALIGTPSYTFANGAFMADVTGNGFIDGTDLSVVRDRRFGNLFPPAAAAVDSVFEQRQGSKMVINLGSNAPATETLAEALSEDEFVRRKSSKFGLRRSTAFMA